MSEQRRQPKPAIGQVWRMPNGNERTIEGFEEDGLLAKFRGSLATWSEGALVAACSCVGLETAAGRVMVGERRQGPFGVRALTRVDVGGFGDLGFVVAGERGEEPGVWLAEAVASWPLLPAASPPRCPCGAAMPASCKMCPGCAAEVAMGFPVVRTDREIFRRGVEDVLSDMGATMAERAAVLMAAELPVGAEASAELHPETARDIVRALRAGKWAAGPIREAHDRALTQGPGIAARPPTPAAPDVVHTARWEDRWGIP